jgi:hypothetical protein
MMQAIVYWLLVQFETIELWHIVILACFLGVVNTINQTARQSLINSFDTKRRAAQRDRIAILVNNFSKITGLSAAGVFIAYIGISGCFLVNAISFVFALQSISDGPAAVGNANRPSALIRGYQGRIRLPARQPAHSSYLPVRRAPFGQYRDSNRHAQNLLGRVLSLFFMDRGLWSLGSLIIGGSAAVIGIEWSFAVCGWFALSLRASCWC